MRRPKFSEERSRIAERKGRFEESKLPLADDTDKRVKMAPRGKEGARISRPGRFSALAVAPQCRHRRPAGLHRLLALLFLQALARVLHLALWHDIPPLAPENRRRRSASLEYPLKTT